MFDKLIEKIVEAEEEKDEKDEDQGKKEDKGKDELLEELAALEHEQWMEWAKNILKSEKISSDRAKHWEDLFVPYDILPEEMKEKDREWAEKVIELLKEQNVL